MQFIKPFCKRPFGAHLSSRFKWNVRAKPVNGFGSDKANAHKYLAPAISLKLHVTIVVTRDIHGTVTVSLCLTLCPKLRENI